MFSFHRFSKQLLRMHWSLLAIFDFWYAKVCILWKFFQYSIHWDKTDMLKIFFGQNKRYKKYPLFSFASSSSWRFSFLFAIFLQAKARCSLHLSKLCLGFSIFDSVLFLLLNVIFLFNKKYGLFDFKTSNSLQNQNNRKVTHTFPSRPLIFRLQQEVLKFSDICVSWSSPITDLETNFSCVYGDVRYFLKFEVNAAR